MNTLDIFHSHPARRVVSTLVFMLVPCVAAPPLLAQGAAPAAASAGNPAERSYVIFAGLDVFVDDRGIRRPVVGGSENEVLVWNEVENAPMAMHNVPLSAAVEPRLTRARVTLDELQGYPVYSPANDPDAARHAQQVFMHNLEGARAEEAEFSMRMSQAMSDSFSSLAPSVSPDSPGAAAYQARVNEAIEQASAATGEMASTMGNPVFRDSEIGSAEGGDNFDGYAVAFLVSAAQPISDAYGVLRLRYRENPLPHSPVRNAMKVFRLRKVDAKPRKVIVRQFGIPPGYTVESYRVHFYADGKELAANTSQNRVEVTEDDAHKFLVLHHAQRNPGATMPAQVALELQHDAPAVIRGSGLDAMLVDLNLTADGTVAAINSGNASIGQLTPEIEAELRHVRFLPALLDGKPVDSRGTFSLSELFSVRGDGSAVVTTR